MEHVKKLFSFLIILLSLISLLPAVFALDGRVAYISSSQGLVNQNFWNEMESLGLTVEFVDSDFIAFTNMSNYNFMFINNEFFWNANQIPVNKMPTLMVTAWNMNDWNWAFTSSSIASNSILKANITNDTHKITQGYTKGQLIKVYDSCCEGNINLPMLYLAFLDRMPWPKRYPNAPNLNNLLAPEIDFRDGVILTAIPGTELKNGVLSQSKGAYFGISEITHWTNDSKQLFAKTVEWLLTDEIPPTISNLNVANRTNESARITFTTDKNANSTISYGTTQSLGNSIYNSQLLTSHGFNLLNLLPGTTYYYQVKTCNKFDYCSFSAVNSFATFKNPPAEVSGLTIAVNNIDNTLTLSWQTSTDAAEYNIYTTTDPASFNFAQPTATVASTNYVDSTTQSSQKRFYVVRAENNEQTEEKNINIVGKFDLQLMQGANLVALPLVPFNPAISNVMHHDLSYNPVAEVKTYVNGNFKTAMFDASVNGFWTTNELSAVANNNAYYFVAKQNTTFTTVGRYTAQQQTVNFINGMNYFGLTSLPSKNIGDVFAQNNATYTFVEVSKRNNDGSFSLATYYPSQNNWFSASGFTTLDPGVGYIVKTNAQTTVSYNP